MQIISNTRHNKYSKDQCIIGKVIDVCKLHHNYDNDKKEEIEFNFYERLVASSL